MAGKSRGFKFFVWVEWSLPPPHRHCEERSDEAIHGAALAVVTAVVKAESSTHELPRRLRRLAMTNCGFRPVADFLSLQGAKRRGNPAPALARNPKPS